LSEESKRRESQSIEASRRSSRQEAELRAQLEKAEKRIIELTLHTEELEDQNDELRKRLSATVG
jgi:hypothetical protein